MTLLLRDADVEALMDVPSTLACLEQAYKWYGEGRAINVPTSLFIVPGGTQEGYAYRQWDLRAALPDLSVSAVGIFSNVIDQSAGTSQVVELPYAKTCDWTLLHHMQTGELLAIIASNYAKRLRVSCTAALGTKYLARANATTLGLIGSGSQAEGQLLAVPYVRSIERVLVYSRAAQNREGFARRMSALYSFPVEAVDSSAEVVEKSDILVSANSAIEPTFDGSLVRSGTHVTTVSHRQVDGTLVARASLFTTTRSRDVQYLAGGQSRSFGGVGPLDEARDRVQDLEQVMAGARPGRTSAEEITLFMGPGVGLQLAAMGHEIYQRARAAGTGRDVPSDWFAPS